MQNNISAKRNTFIGFNKHNRRAFVIFLIYFTSLLTSYVPKSFAASPPREFYEKCVDIHGDDPDSPRYSFTQFCVRIDEISSYTISPAYNELNEYINPYVYDEYNQQVVYGLPHGTVADGTAPADFYVSSKGSTFNIVNGAQGEYRYLGYNYKNIHVTNDRWHNSSYTGTGNFSSANDYTELSYTEISGASISWSNLEDKIRTYMMNTKFYDDDYVTPNDKPFSLLDLWNEDFIYEHISVQSVPGIERSGSLKMAYGSYHNTLIIDPIPFTWSASMTTDKTTYRIPAGEDKVIVDVSLYANFSSTTANSYLKDVEIDCLNDSKSISVTTSGKDYKSEHIKVSFDRSNLDTGSNNVKIEGYVQVNSEYKDYQIKKLSKNITIIVEDNPEPWVETIMKAEPSLIEFKGINMPVKLDITYGIANITDLNKINNIELKVKDEGTFIKSPALVGQHTMNVTIPASFMTGYDSRDKSYEVDVTYNLKDGTSYTAKTVAGVKIVRFKPTQTPSVDAAMSATPNNIKFNNADMPVRLDIAYSISNVEISKVRDIYILVTGEGSFTKPAALSGVHTMNVTIPAYYMSGYEKRDRQYEAYVQYNLTDGTNYKDYTTAAVAISKVIVPPSPTPSPIPTPTPSLNNPPAVRLSAPSSVKVGENFSVYAYANDPDGDELDYDWSYTPATGTMSERYGQLSYDIAYANSNKLVEVHVYDGEEGAIDNQIIHVLEPTVDARMQIGGMLKVNRKVTVKDVSDTPDQCPITIRTWSITPVTSSGTVVADIKHSGDWISETEDVLFKKAGQYKVTLYLRNSAGYEDIAEKIITIAPDLAPIANASSLSTLYRNPDNSNKVTLEINNLSYSPDWDNISTLRLYRKYDSNNNGNFDEHSWVSIYKGANRDVIVETLTDVGKYRYRIEVNEDFYSNTIPGFISSDEYKNSSYEWGIEVINIQPNIQIELKDKKSVNVLFNVGTNKYDMALINSKINSIVTPALLAQNIDFTFNIVEHRNNDLENPIFKNKLHVFFYDYINKAYDLYYFDVMQKQYTNAYLQIPDLMANDAYFNAVVDLEGNVYTLYSPEAYAPAYKLKKNGQDVPFEPGQYYFYSLGMDVDRIGNVYMGGGSYFYYYDKAVNQIKRLTSLGALNIQSAYIRRIKAGYDKAYIQLELGGGEHLIEYDLASNTFKYIVSNISGSFAWCIAPNGNIYYQTGYSEAHYNANDVYTLFAQIFEYNIKTGLKKQLPESYPAYSGNLNNVPQTTTNFTADFNNLLVFGRSIYDNGTRVEYNTESGISRAVTSISNMAFNTLYGAKYDYAYILDNGAHWEGFQYKLYNSNTFTVIETYPNSKYTYNNSSPQIVLAKYPPAYELSLFSLSDAIPDQWNSNTDNYCVNIFDEKLSDIETDEGCNKVLSKTLNNNLCFVGMGTAANSQQINNLINKNDNNGIFIDNSNIDTAMNQLKNYILGRVEQDDSVITKYVLLDEELDITANYDDYENDPQLAIRYSYNHDPGYFDNTLGFAENMGVYMTSPLLSFSKSGKYEMNISVRDNPKNSTEFDNYRLWSYPHNMVLFVHRKPIPIFTVSLTKNGANYNTVYTENSYDLDHTSRPDKGIVQKIWYYREETSSTWIAGKLPSTIPANKTYFVKLEVMDMEYVWASSVQVVSSNEINHKPIAQFYFIKNPVSRYEHSTIANVVVDTSTDPDGDAITERKWTVKKNGVVLADGINTVLNSSGTGKYDVTLEVKDINNAWSEPYTLVLTVVDDTIPPTIYLNPTSSPWVVNNARAESATVNMVANDTGGSGLKSIRYLWTNNPNFADGAFTTVNTTSSVSSTHTSEGIWYLYAQATDNAGNASAVKKCGSYRIDKTSPMVADCRVVGGKYIADDTYWLAKNELLDVYIKSQENLSGMKYTYLRLNSSDVDIASHSWTGTSTNLSESDTSTLTDITVAERTLADSVKGEYEVKFTVRGLNDTIANIHYSFADIAGNTCAYSDSGYKVGVDTLAPTITIDHEDTALGNTNKAVTVGVADSGSGIRQSKYIVSNSSTKPSASSGWTTDYNTKFNFEIASTGTWYVHVESTDNVGNVANKSVGPFFVDLVAPLITVNPTESVWGRNNLSIGISVTEGYSALKEVRYSVTKSSGRVYSGWQNKKTTASNSITITDSGVWYLHVEAEDTAGNETYTCFGPYRVDKELPTITMSYISGARFVSGKNLYVKRGDAVTFRYRGTDSLSGMLRIFALASGGADTSPYRSLNNDGSTYPYNTHTKVRVNSPINQTILSKEIQADFSFEALTLEDYSYVIMGISDDNAKYNRIGWADSGYRLITDNTSPSHSVDVSSGEFIGSTIVNIYASDTRSGVGSISYAWSKSASAPSSGWTTVGSDVATAEQVDEGLWYLYVYSTDRVGNSSTITRYGTYNVVHLSIEDVSVVGYWNHWRGQVDKFGNTLSVEPHRFLSLEKVMITVKTLGADTVIVRFSPELESMVYTDENGNTYRYDSDFNLPYVRFPQDSTFTLNSSVITEQTTYWEYTLPLAESTLSYDNSRLRGRYSMTIIARRGATEQTFVVDDIEITGNIMDQIFIQEK